eukprot:SAG11_NODE_1436_length_4909_cov_3.825780_1_plen_35_part_10
MFGVCCIPAPIALPPSTSSLLCDKLRHTNAHVSTL